MNKCEQCVWYHEKYQECMNLLNEKANDCNKEKYYIEIESEKENENKSM